MLFLHSILLALHLVIPSSLASYHHGAGVLKYVDPKIGTYGKTPNGNGGMIPSVAPPFSMTRWTPQTRENYISQCPYNDLDSHIHGFQATHQPAIWMGESGQVVLNAGVGKVEPLFEKRAHRFDKKDEISTAYVYEVTFEAQTVDAGKELSESVFSPVPGGAQDVPQDVRQGTNGRVRRDIDDYESLQHVIFPVPEQVNASEIKVAMTARSHVGLLRVDFGAETDGTSSDLPYILIQATRQNWTGNIDIDPVHREISGSNPQRQDYALGPSRAPSFRGYFVSRFSAPFDTWGIADGNDMVEGASHGQGEGLSAYVRFTSDVRRVEVRTGVSFVSIEQARRNLDLQTPNGMSFENAVELTTQDWLKKLDRVTIEGTSDTSNEYDQRTIFYTSLFHALQYPSDFSEPLDETGKNNTFYSGYTDSVLYSNESYYQSWSIWDTYRAEHSILAMFAPERVNNMMRSLLRIFDWSGRLPMWANIVETNIMIGTRVDAVIANALVRGFRAFNITKAWQAVAKNAYEPPHNDTDLLYFDREAYTPVEARAGLTKYMTLGYVPNDLWAESASRTLDYAFDDYAASVVASHAGNDSAAEHLEGRSKNWRNLYNTETGFMEARNVNGTWAGPDQGWTEGDKWVYTFNVVHNVLDLARYVGGRDVLKQKLDAHFDGGHNDHTNEPSHHTPYLYATIGCPAMTQNLTRRIAFENYNATSAGLSGNEDLGQMSAWYLFSALGFYPVNPASDKYVVGAPFFDEITIRFPAGASTGGIGGAERTLQIVAPNASKWPYVKSLKVDGVHVGQPELSHTQLMMAQRIEFEMAPTPQAWGAEDIE